MTSMVDQMRSRKEYVDGMRSAIPMSYSMSDDDYQSGIMPVKNLNQQMKPKLVGQAGKEYHDGMSLYAGYFAENFQVDPSGMKKKCPTGYIIAQNPDTLIPNGCGALSATRAIA